ncbi:MAG: hypothetical protein IJC49_04070 [Clostridia bacterium]|nr:hypothetical protein [Clostridia bacterium]
MNDNSIKGLSALSDSQLKGLVGDITAALGVDPKKTRGLDLNRVRATLGSISDEEARRLIDKAGKEKAEEIYNAIRRSKADGR